MVKPKVFLKGVMYIYIYIYHLYLCVRGGFFSPLIWKKTLVRPKKLLGCIDGRLQAVSERWCVVVEGKNQSILLLQQPRFFGCFGAKPKDYKYQYPPIMVQWNMGVSPNRTYLSNIEISAVSRVAEFNFCRCGEANPVKGFPPLWMFPK